jgi:chaperonin GroES
MRYEPLYDRILVRLLRPDERTRGGLFVPQMATDNTPYLKAEVIAVGQGRITTSGTVIPLRVEVGDVVLFFRSQSSGEQLIFPSETPNEELMLIREPNVACMLRDLDKVTSIIGLDGGNLELRS